MRFDLTKPCGNCPFRNDRMPFGLRPGRVREILGGKPHGRNWWPAFSFACHKTVDYDEEVEQGTVMHDSQHCAGVMIILHRENRWNDAMQIANRLGLWNPAHLDMNAPVYATTDEAIQGQGV